MPGARRLRVGMASELLALAIAALILEAGPSAALVALPDHLEKICPYDGTKIEAPIPKQGERSGATFDFQPIGEAVSLSPLLVCPDGFVFFKQVFTPAEIEKLRPFVLSDEFRAIQQDSVHYRAAWLAEKLDQPATEIVEHLLHATWEAPSADAYSRYATQLLEELPKAKAVETDDQKWTRLRLLQGELLRRLGRLDDAHAHFDRLRAERGEGTTEGVLAKLQLALIEKGDTERHVVPKDALERARSTSAWLNDRRPLLPKGSRFEIMRQLPTRGRESFQWDSTSRDIFVLDPTPGTSRITTHSIADGERAVTALGPSEVIDLIAALPNGNLLMSAQPSVTADIQAHLIEVDPKTSREIVSVPSGHRYQRAGLISFDQRFVLLGAEPGLLATFVVKRRTLEHLAGPHERTFPLAMDLSGPRVVLAMFPGAPDQAVIVWNYEQGREEFRFAVDQDELRFILGTAIDHRHNTLYVLWHSPHRDSCRLIAVEMSSGRRLLEQEARFEKPFVPFASLSLSPDGRYLAYACGSKVRVIDPAVPENVLETLTGPGDFDSRTSNLARTRDTSPSILIGSHLSWPCGIEGGCSVPAEKRATISHPNSAIIVKLRPSAGCSAGRVDWEKCHAVAQQGHHHLRGDGVDPHPDDEPLSAIDPG
jgi:hypothetical protein